MIQKYIYKILTCYNIYKYKTWMYKKNEKCRIFANVLIHYEHLHQVYLYRSEQELNMLYYVPLARLVWQLSQTYMTVRPDLQDN